MYRPRIYICLKLTNNRPRNGWNCRESKLCTFQCESMCSACRKSAKSYDVCSRAENTVKFQSPCNLEGRWKMFVDFLPSDFPSVFTEFYSPRIELSYMYPIGSRSGSVRIRIRKIITLSLHFWSGYAGVLYGLYNTCLGISVHCKKRLAIFPSPAGQGVNCSRSMRVWLVTSLLQGTGKLLTFFTVWRCTLIPRICV